MRGFDPSLLVLAALLGRGAALISCPDSGFDLIEQLDICLKVSDSFKTQSSALEECEAAGGTLFQQKTGPIAETIMDMIGLDSGYFWIGVEDKTGDGTFTYLDDTPLGEFAPWYMTPDEDKTANPCVMSTWNRFTTSPMWIISSCYEMKYFACEKPVTALVTVPKCPRGYSAVPDKMSCHKVIRKFRLTYAAARKHCQDKENGDLASRMNERVQRKHMKQIVKKLRKYQFWVGVKYDQANSYYTNPSGDVISSPYPIRWGRRQGNYECVAMRNGYWFRKPCYEKKFFICARTPTQVVKYP